MGINNGKAKWREKVDSDAATARYQNSLSAGSFLQGIVEGSDGKLSPDAVRGSSAFQGYQDFVLNRASAAASRWREGTQGKADKWERNWLKAFGG